MIKLNDIAGYKEEKAEILKIVKLLTNYKKYEEAGIYVPKGLILQGPPGCGKTLFAQAIAGECDVPFYTFQAESDAKVSLEKLTELFKKAKEKTPSIVYIDEIDKLTSSRYLGSDAVRTMVQFLLTELDGLGSSQGVLVIASTNFYDELPDSLVRSGRMDKKIVIDYPDVESRIAILEYYIKKHKVFDHVNLKALALKIKGMSGADIKTLVNNALIEYIDSDKVLTVDDFVGLINQMNFDDIGRRWNNKDVVTRVLVHEVGHSLVNYYLTGEAGSISGVQYGDSAGHTDFDGIWDDDEDIVIDFEEEESTDNVNKQDMLNEIAMLFGGKVAEEVFYGNADSGVSSDVGQAAKIFSFMAKLYFLDSRFIDMDINRLMDMRTVHRYLSERDKVFRRELRICKRIIKSHKALIRYIVDQAMENEDTLNAQQVVNCIKYYDEHKKELIKKYAKTPLLAEEKDKKDAD